MYMPGYNSGPPHYRCSAPENFLNKSLCMTQCISLVNCPPANLWVTIEVSQLVSWDVCLVGHLYGLSVGQSVAQLVICLVSQLVGWSVGFSVGYLVGWSVN